MSNHGNDRFLSGEAPGFEAGEFDFGGDLVDGGASNCTIAGARGRYRHFDERRAGQRRLAEWEIYGDQMRW
jgi:hypothetical protein